MDILIESAFNQLFTRQFHDEPSAVLEKAIRYSALSGGKYIRSRLLLSTAGVLELPIEKALPAACALELGHCFTLIHDDLPCMDNDDWRRGKLSNHKVFGEAMALLAGDGLLSLAFASFLETKLDASYVLAGFKRFNQAFGVRGVIGGQGLELQLHEAPSLDNLILVQERKTAPLFQIALEIPAIFLGIPPDSKEKKSLSNFGKTLGLCFQWADDLEDEKVEPTNLRAYLSFEQALQYIQTHLDQAVDELQKTWGIQRTTPLTSFVSEILTKAEKASHQKPSSQTLSPG